MKSPQEISGSHSRFVFAIIFLLFLFVLLSSSSNLTILGSFSSTSRVKSLFPHIILDNYNPDDEAKSSTAISESPEKAKKKQELDRSRIAVCLVGGARRFELTGPSILEYVLKPFPNNADLFLHSPLDKNSFKFSLLKMAPRIASVRIFQPELIEETPERVQVLTSYASPSGLQGLLQYFNLVEGCLSQIKEYQQHKNFSYDWIVRARVDGYWNAPIDPNFFVSGRYVVPSGLSYGGLNDRLGIGDLNSSLVALSRLALIPKLHAAGFRGLNSESAFKAQLTTQGISHTQKRIPFCVVTEHIWTYAPIYQPAVAAMSSVGPLNGCYCKPCSLVCKGTCMSDFMSMLNKTTNWTDWENEDENLQLCDPRSSWEKDWEKVFDGLAGTKFASSRKRVSKLTFKECVDDFEKMKMTSSGSWDAPLAEEICNVGLGLNRRKDFVT